MRRYIPQHWVAARNLRGFLPDTEHVLHGLSLEHAVDYTGGELAHVADYTEDPRVSRQFSVAWRRLQDWDLAALERLAIVGGDNGTAEWAVQADGHYYWVRPCFAINCDQVKTEEN
jgi:hypothetical protein